ncbi:MAG: hypothetical protein J5736_03985, partial [Bacilli bacterium]|nr:hypothetical protein [Bacilli bacterium]
PTTVFLSVIAYLLLGFFLPNNTGWEYWWVVFFMIPIVAELCAFIRTKNLNTIPVVFFCCITFFLLGFYLDAWHPAWIVFLAVPLYHSAVSPIDHALKNRKAKKRREEKKAQSEE